MRLYVVARFERDGSATILSDFQVKTRVAVSPEGAVRQMMELAALDALPAEHLRDDPQGLSHRLSGKHVHYDVSEHDLDAGGSIDAKPAHLTDEEFAEFQEWYASGQISARVRSLMKRLWDAPLPHQVSTPEEREEYWRGVWHELGYDEMPSKRRT